MNSGSDEIGLLMMEPCLFSNLLFADSSISRSGSINEFIQPAGFSGTDAAPLSDHNTLDGTQCYRVVGGVFPASSCTHRQIVVGPPIQWRIQVATLKALQIHLRMALAILVQICTGNLCSLWTVHSPLYLTDSQRSERLDWCHRPEVVFSGVESIT